TFEDNHDATLKDTTKEIRAYAVASDNRYDDSDYARWRSSSYKAPTVTISSDKNKIIVSDMLTNFDYKYSLNGGTETSFSGSEIDITATSAGNHSIKVTGYANDNVKDGRFNGKTFTTEFTFTK
ncbi:MAG: hypothetical protein RSC41_04850, partial [Oscillospiraceae bacterium]